MEKKSFVEIFSKSCKLSFTHPLLFVWGVFLALPTLIQQYLSAKFSPEASYEEITTHISTALEHIPLSHLVGSIFLIALFITLGKTNIIPLLNSEKKNGSQFTIQSFKKHILIFSLLFLFILLTLLVILLLSMPFIFFFVRTHEFSSLLATFATLTFLPIFLVFFLLEMFASFYIILSSLTFRDALENSARVFLKHWRLSVKYTLLFLFTLTIFTFLFNLVMLGIAALLQPLPISRFTETFLFAGTSIFIVWTTIVRYAFYLLFFKDQATPRKEKLSTEEVIVGTALKDTPSV